MKLLKLAGLGLGLGILVWLIIWDQEDNAREARLCITDGWHWVAVGTFGTFKCIKVK